MSKWALRRTHKDEEGRCRWHDDRHALSRTPPRDERQRKIESLPVSAPSIHSSHPPPLSSSSTQMSLKSTRRPWHGGGRRRSSKRAQRTLTEKASRQRRRRPKAERSVARIAGTGLNETGGRRLRKPETTLEQSCHTDGPGAAGVGLHSEDGEILPNATTAFAVFNVPIPPADGASMHAIGGRNGRVYGLGKEAQGKTWQ